MDSQPIAPGATWAVVPAFNESGAIGDVVSSLVGRGLDVVVVDDGSSDPTGDRAGAAGAVVVTHPVNRGQGAALQTGLRYALGRGAEFIVTFDADGQHRPEDVLRLLAPLASGEAHIALGSRRLGAAHDMPISRRLLLALAVVFTRWTSRLEITDTHNGLRAFSREAAGRVHLKMDRMAHASELLDQVRLSGLAYTEVPVEIHYTAYSRAKGQHGIAAVRIVLDYLAGRWIGR